MDPSIPAAALATAAAAVMHPTDEGRESDSGPQPMDIDGQWTIARSPYCRVLLAASVYDAHMCVLSLRATGACAIACARQDGTGNQLCERCPIRIRNARKKGKLYSCPPGLMCHKCYDKNHQPAASKRPHVASSDADVAVPAPKRVRRTQSDPGELINITRKRTRAEHPTTVPSKKTRVRTSAVDSNLLLDQTHVQRLALLAAVATNAALSHCVSNASAVVFDNDT